MNNGAGPLVCPRHHILREMTDITENGTQHHADKKRREADMDSSYIKLYHGKRNRQKYKGDHNGKTFAVRLEIFFCNRKKPSHNGSQKKRQDHFNQRLYQDRGDIETAR